ncbi:MAG: T9SS type A sorting domain-containing protein, partial [Bacteroidia bacterium]
MRKFVFALLLAIVSTVSFAQTTITKNDLPQIGQFYLRDTMTDLNPNWQTADFDKINNTSPISFDFSWLNGGNFDTVLFYNPDTTEFKDSFPNADLAMRQDFDFMMELRDSGLYVQGMSLQGQIAKFDSALKYLPTPLTLGTSYYSKGSTELNIGFAQIYIDYERNLEAIKQGSANMPNDSTYDVLVLDIKNDLSFIVVAGTDTVSTFSEVENVYEFYSPKFGYPLIRGKYDTVTTKVFEAQFIDLTTPTAINKNYQTLDLKAFPNPSQNGVFQLNASKKIEQLYIFDGAGKLVKSLNPNAQSVSVTGLNSGVYQVLV